MSAHLLVFIWCTALTGATGILIWAARRQADIYPSRILYEHPAKGLWLSLIYMGAAILLIEVFNEFLPAEDLSILDWIKNTGAKGLTVGFAIGAFYLPVNLTIKRLFGGASKPSTTAAKGGGFILASLFANAFIEEATFRMVPITLAPNAPFTGGFLIPALFFTLIHFLERGRMISPGRIADLIAGALLFFLIARDYGLMPSVAAHFTINISRTFILGAAATNNERIIQSSSLGVLAAILWLL